MEEEKDDEISLDFSKIKNFFKRKKENKEEVPAKIENKDPEIKNQAVENIELKKENQTETEKSDESHQEKDDDEISIDFSKIKNIFKRKEIHSEEIKSDVKENKDDDEISIDFSKIKNIFKSSSKDENKSETEGSDDDISVDFKKNMGFYCTV